MSCGPSQGDRKYLERELSRPEAAALMRMFREDNYNHNFSQLWFFSEAIFQRKIVFFRILKDGVALEKRQLVFTGSENAVAISWPRLKSMTINKTAVFLVLQSRELPVFIVSNGRIGWNHLFFSTVYLSLYIISNDHVEFGHLGSFWRVVNLSKPLRAQMVIIDEKMLIRASITRSHCNQLANQMMWF